MLVHKCSVECSAREKTEYYSEYSWANPRVTLLTEISHEYCLEYLATAHTAIILRVLIRVI
jgi:hypothetical protein